MNLAYQPLFREFSRSGKIAIIDMGSNTVRMVVYDGIKRVSLPIYNEKQFCGLGRDIIRSGKLDPEAKSLAQKAIKRFMALAQSMDVVSIDVLATAAIRDAEDGQAFVEELEQQFGLNIAVISGKKEAQLAAYGIFSSFYDPRGVALDFGGGSMELVTFNNHHISTNETFPVGVLKLIETGNNDPETIQKLIDKTLMNFPWDHVSEHDHLYAIGGSFRALGKLHMKLHGYPLSILNSYTLSASELEEFAHGLVMMPQAKLEQSGLVSETRINAMVPAILLLQHIMKKAVMSKVIFSASGIREGYLYEKLAPHIRTEDPLIASASDMASQLSRLSSYAKELYEWMSPLFQDEDTHASRLRFAACILSEIAWRLHPKYRAQGGYDRIINSSMIGLNHKERIKLALCNYHRYQSKFKQDGLITVLCDEKDMAWSRLVGTASNLAYNLSGGMEDSLHHSQLSIKQGKVHLDLEDSHQDIEGETVAKRLEGLGDTFNAYCNFSR
jgi:exopolyphosphatase/guanosine-5'-triphosphate,3'-diphosphate pyrophosphatase